MRLFRLSIVASILIITGIVVKGTCCQSNASTIENSNKYALIIVASGRGERPTATSDPIDKNFFWLSGVKTYTSLRVMGFKPQNIRVIYSDGRPDFNDPIEPLAEKLVKNEQFNGTYDNSATRENINAQLQRFSKVVTDKDMFVLFVATHGNVDMLEIEAGGNLAWTVKEFQDSVVEIRPAMGLIYLDSCHSGAFIKELELPNYVVMSTTTETTYGWGDRYFSGGAYFFSSAVDGESDTNMDGLITVKEAYDRGQIRARDHIKRINDYLKHKYHYDFGSYDEMMNPNSPGIKSSVEQRMVVGKKVTADYSLFNTF